jgi:hypothetical protein
VRARTRTGRPGAGPLPPSSACATCSRSSASSLEVRTGPAQRLAAAGASGRAACGRRDPARQAERRAAGADPARQAERRAAARPPGPGPRRTRPPPDPGPLPDPGPPPDRAPDHAGPRTTAGARTAASPRTAGRRRRPPAGRRRPRAARTRRPSRGPTSAAAPAARSRRPGPALSRQDRSHRPVPASSSSSTAGGSRPSQRRASETSLPQQPLLAVHRLHVLPGQPHGPSSAPVALGPWTTPGPARLLMGTREVDRHDVGADRYRQRCRQGRPRPTVPTMVGRARSRARAPRP